MPMCPNFMGGMAEAGLQVPESCSRMAWPRYFRLTEYADRKPNNASAEQSITGWKAQLLVQHSLRRSRLFQPQSQLPARRRDGAALALARVDREAHAREDAGEAFHRFGVRRIEPAAL